MVSQTLPRELNTSGVRRMDPARDLAGIANVIEVAFAEELSSGGHAIMRDLNTLNRMRPLVWLLSRTSPIFRDLFSGFVWEVDDRIVGNTTISRVNGASSNWVISNVAVLPDYRRRGIGYELVRAAVDYAYEHGARRVALQVHEDNEAAIRLYETLGFETLDTVVELQTHYVAVPDWSIQGNVATRVPEPARWREAYRMASTAVPPAVQIMHPVRPSRFRTTPSSPLIETLRYIFVGYRQEQRWAERNGRLLGMMEAERHRGSRASKVELIIHPQGRDEVEEALLLPALRFLRGKHLVRTQLPTELQHAVSRLREIGFVPVRTLDQMVLEH